MRPEKHQPGVNPQDSRSVYSTKKNGKHPISPSTVKTDTVNVPKYSAPLKSIKPKQPIYCTSIHWDTMKFISMERKSATKY
ncbi:MAG: hypothetical protein PHY69_08440 [Dysgonamonadaceae bacterium]|nr:hypothetical protein [Dysgonamonadaceae bacterium]